MGPGAALTPEHGDPGPCCACPASGQCFLGSCASQGNGRRDTRKALCFPTSACGFRASHTSSCPEHRQGDMCTMNAASGGTCRNGAVSSEDAERGLI